MNYIINKAHYNKNIGLFTQITTDQDGYIHRHEYYEIFYILNGSISHLCNNITEHLSIGDFLILRPNDIHQFIRKNNSPCSHRDILIDTNLFDQVLTFLNPKFLENLKNAQMPYKTNMNISKLHSYENNLNNFNHMPEMEISLTEYAKCVLTNILSDMLLNSKNIISYDRMPSLVKNIISLLNTTDGIINGIPSVLKRYTYSPIYLSRLFKQHMGITMTDYLKNVRLNYAELYLQTTSLTLEEITEQIGLSSVSYFNKIFKEKHETTPVKYRNNFKKTNHAK